MNKKIETSQKYPQPESTPPVIRQATGTLFNVQPNGGVEASIILPQIVIFAGDDAE